MDWLLARQARVEKKLAAGHLGDGALVLYDVSSSYYEGHTCPLARLGHDRDGKRGLPIIVYGLRTDTQIGRLREHPGAGLDLGAARAGRVLNRFKLDKHFSLTIADGGFGWSRREESIRRVAELHSVYVVRTSEPKSRCSAEDTVRHQQEPGAGGARVPQPEGD